MVNYWLRALCVPEYPFAQLHTALSSSPGDIRSIFSIVTGHCIRYGVFSVVMSPSSSGPLSVCGVWVWEWVRERERDRDIIFIMCMYLPHKKFASYYNFMHMYFHCDTAWVKKSMLSTVTVEIGYCGNMDFPAWFDTIDGSSQHNEYEYNWLHMFRQFCKHMLHAFQVSWFKNRYWYLQVYTLTLPLPQTQVRTLPLH